MSVSPGEEASEGGALLGTTAADRRIGRDGLRFSQPSDGQLVPLVLHTFQSPSLLPPTSEWVRLGIPPTAVNLFHKLSYWVGSSLRTDGTSRQIALGITLTALKYVATLPLSCILGQGVSYSPTNSSSSRRMKLIQADTRFDRVYIRTVDGSTHVTSVSDRDDIHETGQHDLTLLADAGLRSRPRYLCYITDYEQCLYETIDVADYVRTHGTDVDLEFIFVSYTRTQFNIAGKDGAEHSASQEFLIQSAVDAAKQVQKKAFWIDFECVRNADGVARTTSKSEDVYRICDIVRAAHSMIIVVGPSMSDEDATPSGSEPLPTDRSNDVTKWLRQWGSRLWTLPELLLSPGEHRIKLYVAGSPAKPISLAKRNFAERAWDDAEAVKELVDHYEGSAVLTQLQLIETALACFARRTTAFFTHGDVAYAIMGLFPLSQRPAVNPQDSSFQAFARFSLSSRGDQFLERLLCLRSPKGRVSWHETTDVWGAKLGDVTPACRVIDVLENSTILLDGALGTTIHWNCLGALHKLSRASNVSESRSLPYMLAVALCVFLPKAALVYILVVRTIMTDSSVSQVLSPYPFYFMAFFGCIGPILVYLGRRSKKSVAKSDLLGLEGHVDPATLERHLWGFTCGRLKQVSGHAQLPADIDQPGHEMDPYDSEKTEFTLVDTKRMTVMHIRCAKPPVAMFVLGRVGSTHRAMFCSYDWKDNSFAEEFMTTLQGDVVEELRSVDAFRLRVWTSDVPALADLSSQRSSETNELGTFSDPSVPPPRDGVKRWKTEAIFAVALASTISLRTLYFGAQSSYPGTALRYWVSFVVAASVEALLMYRLPISLVFPQICNLKAFSALLPIFPQMVYYDYFRYIPEISGFVDGILLFILTSTMWSWFGSRALATRLIFLATFCQFFTWLVYFLPSWCQKAYPIFASITYFIIAAQDFGPPLEISWLSSCDQMIIARRSALAKSAAESELKWTLRDHRLLKNPRPMIAFGVSLCTSLFSNPHAWQMNFLLDSCQFGTLGLVGLCVFYLPKSQFPIMVVIAITAAIGTMLSTLRLPLAVALVFELAASLQPATLGLLWAWCATSAGSFRGALQALVFSMIGLAASPVIKSFSTVHTHWGFALAAVSVDLALLFFMWKTSTAPDAVRDRAADDTPV